MIAVLASALKSFSDRRGPIDATLDHRRGAVRLAATDRFGDARGAAISRTYRDERDLGRQLAELDQELDRTRLTVVVVLDESTRRRFTAGTIRRSSPAYRLALTTTFGAGPAHDFVGDLAARASALGWMQIVCDRNCDRAVRESIETTLVGETCVVFRPL